MIGAVVIRDVIGQAAQWGLVRSCPEIRLAGSGQHGTLAPPQKLALRAYLMRVVSQGASSMAALSEEDKKRCLGPGYKPPVANAPEERSWLQNKIRRVLRKRA